MPPPSPVKRNVLIPTGGGAAQEAGPSQRAPGNGAVASIPVPVSPEIAGLPGGAPARPQGQPSAEAAERPGLQQMPVEVVRHIAMLLTPSDRLALAAAGPSSIYPVIRWEARAAVVIADIEQVKNLMEFQALIDSGAILALPVSLQCEPWVALGARAAGLESMPESQGAGRCFFSAAQAYTGPRSALLGELLEAAALGSKGMARWSEVVTERVKGDGRAAVEGGASVPEVARQLGVSATSKEFIMLQSYAAHTQGLDAVRRGEPVERVLRRIGISQPDLVYGLQQSAATAGDGGRVLARRPRDACLGKKEIAGLYDVYAGEPDLPEYAEFRKGIHEVERQQGLRKKLSMLPMPEACSIPYQRDYTNEYWEFATLHEALPRPVRDESLVALGAHLASLRMPEERSFAVRKFLEAAKDLDGPISPLLDELLGAANQDSKGNGLVARDRALCAGPVRIAVEQGENIQEVIQRFGISSLENLVKLEHLAMKISGYAAVEGGENVQVVVQRLGISTSKSIRDLEALAMFRAQAALERGEGAEAIIQTFGFVSSDFIRIIKDEALRGSARTEVESGENVRVVAQRHGLTEPADLFVLESFSINGPACRVVARGECTPAFAAHKFGISNLLNILRLAEIAAGRQTREEASAGPLDLHEALKAWARDASPGEKRNQAHDEILRSMRVSDKELDLRKMMLREWPPRLDQALPGLRMLRAKGNPFDETPDVRALPELRNLDFSDCRLEDPPPLKGLNKLNRLDLIGNRLTDAPVARDLPELEVLNLDMNCLRVPSDLRLCRKLRHVNMNRNQLHALPDVRDLPALKNLFLANNQFETVPEWIAQLSAKVYIDLSGNPLTPETIAFLKGLTGGPTIHYDGQVVSREDRPPASLPGQVGIWLAAQPEMPADQRQSLLKRWAGFEQEPEAGQFTHLLHALVRTKEFQDSEASRQALGRRVADLLDVLAKDSTLRLQCFEAARQGLAAFGDIEVAARASALAGQPDALLKLARGQYRLALVEEIAREDVNARQGGIDKMEVLLFYRVKLADFLDVPAQPDLMLFESLASVSDEQLAQAKEAVLAKEKEDADALIASIARQPFWQASLETQPTCAKAIEQMDDRRTEQIRKLDERDTPRRSHATQEERDSRDSDLNRDFSRRNDAIDRQHKEGVTSVHRQFTRIAMDRVKEGLPPIDAALPPPVHVIAAAKVSDIAVQLQGLIQKKENREAEILARQLLEPELLAALHVRPAEMGRAEAEVMDIVNVQYMALLRMLATEKLLDEVAFDRLRGGDLHPTEKETPYLLYIASRAGSGAQGVPAAASELAHAAAQLITTLAETRELGKGQDRKRMRTEMLADLRRSHHPAQGQGLGNGHKDSVTRILTRGSTDTGTLASQSLESLKSLQSGSKTLADKGEELAKVVRTLGEQNVAAAHAKHAELYREHLATEAANKPMKDARQSIYSAVYSAVDTLWATGTRQVRNALAPNPLAYLGDSDDAAARANASQSLSLRGPIPTDLIDRACNSLLASSEGQAMLKLLVSTGQRYNGGAHREFEKMLQDRVREHVLPILGNVGPALHREAQLTAAISRARSAGEQLVGLRAARAGDAAQTRLVQLRAAETGTSAGGTVPAWGSGPSFGRTMPANEAQTATTALGLDQAQATQAFLNAARGMPDSQQDAGPSSGAEVSAQLLIVPPAPNDPIGPAERHTTGPMGH